MKTTAKALKDALIELKRTTGKREPWCHARIVGDTIYTQDGDMATAIQLPGSGELNTAVLVSDLATIVKTVAGDVELSNSGGRLTAGAVSVPTVDVDAVPVFPVAGRELVADITFDGPHLKRALDYVLPCASRDFSRAGLHGVFIERDGDGLRFTATDTHRLASMEIFADVDKWKIEPVNYDGFVLPFPAVEQAQRLLKRYGGDIVRVLHEGGNVVVYADVWRIVARTSNPSFPMYRSVIPETKQIKTRIDVTEELHAAVVACMPFAGKEKFFPVILDIDESGVTVSAKKDGSTVFEQSLGGIGRGGALKVGFNVRYLEQAFGANLGGEFRLVDDFGPAIIESINGMQVVMPMRI